MMHRVFTSERLAGFVCELGPHGKYSRVAYWLAIVIILVHYRGLITVNSLRAEYNHFDEPNWMWISAEVWKHVRAGDWHGEFWTREYADWGTTNPQLGKYFMGAPLDHYLRTNPDIPLHEFGNFGDTKNPRIWPNERLYYPARIQSAVFAMLTALLLVDLAAALFGSWTALFACLWFVSHPYIRVISFRAMTDACALFGTMLAFYGLFRKRTWAMVLVTGLGLGWAAATKMTCVLICAAICITLWLRVRSEGRRRLAYLFIPGLVLILALAIFYGTNPYLWRKPSGVMSMLSNRPGRSLSMFQVMAALFWDTLRPGGLENSAVFTRALRLAMLLYAAAILIRTRDLPRRLFLHGSFVFWGLLVLVVGVPWERYYIYGLPMICILAGYGCEVACRLTWPWLRSAVEKGRRLAVGVP
jgi:hypothetical protein